MAQRRRRKKTNLIGRLFSGQLSKNDLIRLVAVVIFLTIFVVCMVYIGSVKAESKKNEQLSDALKDMVQEEVKPHEVKHDYPKSYLTKFSKLYEQNRDVAGWIKIPDTKLDYVVVQTTDNNYYERRDFTEAHNDHGVPFVDFRVDLKTPSTNTVIYAHNMNDGQMFGELMNYKSLKYYQEHPIIEFDSVYREDKYKIFGIVLCKKNDPEFNYHNFIDKESDEAMAEFVNKVRERSLINTTVDMKTGDRLLTLSTCDYSFKSNEGDRIARFVVFARAVRPDESPEVNVAGATLNTNPIMPEEWYIMLRKKQEAELKAQQEKLEMQENAKWLTAEEKKTLTKEQQKELANERREDSEKYLSFDERNDLDLEGKIELMEERKFRFNYFLTSKERQNMGLSKKLKLSAERMTETKKYLTEEEVVKAKTWENIEKLLNERKGAEAEFKLWLTEDEIASLSPEKKQKLVTDRKAEAKKYGIKPDEYSSWGEIKKAIENAKLLQEQSAAIDKYIKENIPFLEAADKEGNSLEKLQSIKAERKALAEKYGIDTGKYKSWKELKKAIDAKTAEKELNDFIKNNAPYLEAADNKGNMDALKKLLDERKKLVSSAGVDAGKYKTWPELKAAVEAAQKDKADREKFVKDNAPYLESADSAKKMDELQALLAERKALAEKYGLNGADYKSWAELKKAIDKKKDEEFANQFINGNRPYLDDNDKGKTIDELQKLLTSRKERVKAAGVSAGGCKTWAEVEAKIVEAERIIAEKKQFIADNAPYFNSDEVSLSMEELKNLLAQRKNEAGSAGVASDGYKSWNELKKAIDKKLDEKAAADLIAKNAPYLDANDSGKTFNELKSLLSARKEKAKGIDVSGLTLWSEVEAKIAEAERIEAERKQFIRDNRSFFNGDENGKDISALKALMEERKAVAAAEGIDPLSYGSWADVEKAISEKHRKEQEAKEKAELLKNNSLWLTGGDSEKSLSDLKGIINSRKKDVKGYGISESELKDRGATNWNECMTVIEQILDERAAEEEKEPEPAPETKPSEAPSEKPSEAPETAAPDKAASEPTVAA